MLPSATEYYTIFGRTYAVGAASSVCSPVLPVWWKSGAPGYDGWGSACSCALQRLPRQRCSDRGAPIFPANCSALGQLVASRTADLMKPVGDRQGIAQSLLATARADLEIFLEDVAGQLDSLASLKQSTRYENLRRLGIARGYLHDVTERPVALAELATVACISRLQLLRHFRDCFGLPPGAYHRRLRLLLAKQGVDSRQLSCTEAADRFGFAGGSSFSHAYRRAFGTRLRTIAAGS